MGALFDMSIFFQLYKEDDVWLNIITKKDLHIMIAQQVTVSIQYKAPNYLNDELLVEAKITQKIDSVKVLVMDVTITNLTRATVAAKAKIQAGLLEMKKPC